MLAACDFLTENRRNLALGIIGLIRKANNHGVVDVPVTGFFPYPSIYLSLSVFLSDFGRVGSAAEKRLTADDGQAASAGYKGWGEARRAGPAGAYSQTEARTRIYVCIHTFNGCIILYNIHITIIMCMYINVFIVHTGNDHIMMRKKNEMINNVFFHSFHMATMTLKTKTPPIIFVLNLD